MEKNVCENERYGKAITNLFKSGKLTFEEASARLIFAIEAEAEKTKDKLRLPFIKACCELLYILNSSEDYVSQADISRKHLEEQLAKEENSLIF